MIVENHKEQVGCCCNEKWDDIRIKETEEFLKRIDNMLIKYSFDPKLRKALRETKTLTERYIKDNAHK